MITYETIRKDETVNTYIRKADEALAGLGYTEHSFPHVTRVAETARYILRELGYSEHTVDLVGIAAHMHDIGNLVNRVAHSQSGAIMAFRLLDHMGMDPEDISTVVTAIGNHDEGTGVPLNAVAAALILADKCDVIRSRVRNDVIADFDIHDRVNYSVTEARLTLSEDKRILHLTLAVDTQYSSIMDYFEIFLDRMNLCRKAAEKLDTSFKLTMNGQTLS